MKRALLLIIALCLFQSSALAGGNPITKWNYYANNTNAFKVLLIDAGNVLQYKSALITPPATGVQSYTEPSPVTYQQGWRVGIYFAATGTVPFDDGVGANFYYTNNGSGEPTVGNTITFNAPTPRTYSINGVDAGGTTVCGNAAIARTTTDSFSNFVIMDTNNNTPAPNPPCGRLTLLGVGC